MFNNYLVKHKLMVIKIHKIYVFILKKISFDFLSMNLTIMS